ncbi:unnamed protein product [Phytophthora fragariaefolia]|uniref:Unnamed protein product n=1 Tax=Phytophthora fragariaefolia TaxID=1490495 RepID=A0A9W6TZY8_9STRA|nr:unnamed protein product [Phytophthora fragariaefolia]
MLFILAIELLYRLVDITTDIKGIQLANATQSFLLKVAGFADDTAIYLRTPAEVPVVLTITSSFGVASGLNVNIKKTMIIALGGKKAAAGCPLPPSLEILDPTRSCRYLGVQVGSSTSGHANWDTALRQL